MKILAVELNHHFIIAKVLKGQFTLVKTGGIKVGT
jgi:hypothetical protein